MSSSSAKNALISALQGASNAAASNVSGPVDLLAWALRKAGVPVPSNAFGGSEWMRQQGLTAEPTNKLAGMLGEGVGLAAPFAIAAKAPQIAGAMNKADDALTAGANRMADHFERTGAAYRYDPKQRGAHVWHGSPHKFDRFDASKIGTGEGRQQQGVGLYIADARQVGQKYADKEAWKRGMDSGYLYKVEAPDDLLASMANHDMPLFQQPANVQAGVRQVFDADAKKALKDYHGWDNPQEAPFAAVMDAIEIAKGNNRSASSEILRKAGIPGIRYLDGGSRGAGAGTSNYVVFPGEEAALNILERNGSPINALVQALKGPR